jgi:hypothetical protein
VDFAAFLNRRRRAAWRRCRHRLRRHQHGLHIGQPAAFVDLIAGPPEDMRIVVIRSSKNFGMLPDVEKMVPAKEQPAPTSV